MCVKMALVVLNNGLQITSVRKIFSYEYIAVKARDSTPIRCMGAAKLCVIALKLLNIEIEMCVNATNRWVNAANEC
jgi:hypothetical protein